MAKEGGIERFAQDDLAGNGVAVGESEGQAGGLGVEGRPDQRQRPESLAVDQVARFVDDRERSIAGDAVEPEMSVFEEDERHRFDRRDRDPGDAPDGGAHTAIIAEHRDGRVAAPFGPDLSGESHPVAIHRIRRPRRRP
jgi:hypothetical protein